MSVCSSVFGLCFLTHIESPLSILEKVVKENSFISIEIEWTGGQAVVGKGIWASLHCLSLFFPNDWSYSCVRRGERKSVGENVGGRGGERQAVYLCTCHCVEKKKQSPSIIIPHLPFMNMCTDCHCVAWIKAQGYNRSFGLWTLLAGQNNYKWSGVAFFLCYSMGAAWFLSKLKEKREWGEGWERQRETEGQGRFILNECAADASHKCACTLADSRSHVYSAIVSPFLSLHLAFIYSISLRVTRSVSHAITHRQLPGERLLL